MCVPVNEGHRIIVDKAMGAGSRLRRTWMDLKVLNLVEKMTCNNIKWNKRIHQATPKFCCKRFVDVGVALLRVLLIITSDTFSEHMDYAPFFLGGRCRERGGGLCILNYYLNLR